MKLYHFLLILLPTLLFSQRITIPFNEGWQFSPQSKTEFESTKIWENITIPHPWNLDAYEKRDYVRNTFWYKKDFQIPKNLQNKSLFLRFEAVNSYAEVYLNGHFLTKHNGGYGAFHVKLPKEFLQDGTNLLTVKVDNQNKDIPPLSGDFTIFGGIYRDVWLIGVEDAHFDLENYGSKGVFVSTPEVSNEKAKLLVKGKVSGLSSNLSVQVKIRFKENTIETRKIELADSNFELNTIQIENPNLWSPENPNLYRATLELIKEGKRIDKLDIPFGIRWFSADTKNGFQLNGKPLKLMGTNRHQDKFPFGIAVPNQVHHDDMALIKNMGANFVRLAHYQQDDEVLKACDSLGLLVWEEIPVVDIISTSTLFEENSKSALKEMIRQHYNHPSVIFWGYMNEVIIQIPYRVEKEKQAEHYQKTVELAKKLEKLLKEEDPNRLSAMAYHGVNLYNEIGLNGIADVAGWNLYQGWYGDRLEDFEKYVDKQHQLHPNLPIVISEFGAGSDKRLHSLDPEIFDFSIEYQQKLLEHYLPKIMERTHVIGAAEWNFIDFNVATRQESMPRTNNKGLVYNNRTPKDVFYYFQSFLRRDQPILHIATKDWQERAAITDEKSASFPIKIYSNLNNVQLFVNGLSVGEKKLENSFAIWEVPFKDGENTLKAIGNFNGKEIVAETSIDISIKPRTSLEKKKTDIRINVGSNCDFTSENGKIYVADLPYQKGSFGYMDGEIFRKSPGRIGTTAEVLNTKDTPLFQTKRENISQYKFDVPKGHYIITLGFADLYNPQQKQAYDISKSSESVAISDNVFDVLINNIIVLENYSLSTKNKADIKVIDFENKSNSITIQFIPKKGKTFINTIEISSK